MAQGERLEVRRWLAGSALAYWHHGIDMGDGTVVHARPDDFQRPFAGGRVVRTSLEEFAGGAEVTVVADPPAVHAPEEVAGRALSRVGRDGYCPVVDNCEHLATWAATGRHRSRQVEAVLAIAAAAVVWVGGAAARAAIPRGSGQSA